MILVEKKVGDNRFSADHRRLNDSPKRTTTRCRGMTLPGTLLQRCNGSVPYIWRVATGADLRQFAVTPFGLFSASVAYDRIMKVVMKELSWMTCLGCLDDIIVIGKTFYEHLEKRP